MRKLFNYETSSHSDVKIEDKSSDKTTEVKPKRSSSQNDNIFGRLMNKSDVQEEKNVKTRFSDVLGIDEFKDELIELVDYLKNP